MMENDGTLPLRYDLNLYHGDTFRLGVRLRQANNTAYELTGCVILAQIRRAKMVPGTLIPLSATLDAEDDTLIWLEIENYSSIQRFPEAMSIGVWDLQITWPSGDVVTYLDGEVILEGDVSYA